jgi:glutamate--cysteine ligase
LAVTQGRDPELLLQNGSESVLLSQWALALFSDIQKVAVLLDNANKTTAYTEAVRAELEKVHNSDMTPSGKMLEKMLSENLDNSVYGKDLAAQYRDAVKEKTLTVYDLAHFTSAADDSIRAQAEIEASDTLTFSEFLADYFKY